MAEAGDEAARKALELARETGCKLHIVHVSCGEAIAHIAVANEDSKCFFRSMGFRPLEETWSL